jgi:Stage II sporulation protein E (SpoIIE)
MRRGGILALIAAFGIILLAIFAPRSHPAASWNISTDREQAQVRAREISTSLGVDTTGWAGTVTASTDSKAGFQAEQHPGLAEVRRFSPIAPRVAFKAPTGPGRVLVKLSASGDFNSWEWRGYPSSKTSDDATAQALAQTTLTKLMGPDAPEFQQTADPTHGSDGIVYQFQRNKRLGERFELTINANRLVKAELSSLYDAKGSRGLQISSTLNNRKKYVNWFTGAVGVVIDFGGGLLAACVYIFWAVRRAVKHRFVLAFCATTLVWGALYWNNWMLYDQRYDALTADESMIGNFFGGLGILCSIFAFYLILVGATDAIGLRPKLVGLRSLFSSATLNRHAGRSILVGFLCAPLLTALPLLVSSLHLLGSQRTGDYDASVVYSAHPFLQACTVLASAALIGLFGFGTGFIGRYVRRPRLAQGLVAVIGVMLLATVAVPSETSPAAFLLNGALLFLVYYQLFLRVDLLAVLAAGWFSQSLWNAASLLLQPAPSIHNSGIGAIALLTGAAGCAALVAWRGSELALDNDVAPAVVTSRREALMREFSIAHRVQKQMLPDEPPVIPGCSVSASCQPAQEVGGDLFDFLKLPDGRWTIGVGDVSGKGVPAALYMTLTKGLLMATTQDSNDLVDIIGHVNHHIHSATEKKTFVTMALGAFDSDTLAFEHVRAGHNPIVWRRPLDDATSLLNAPGVGLGIVSDRLFRRGVKLDRLQLTAGDALVFYSDGVTEAMNSEREQFGEERLMAAVKEADGLDAGGVRERIVDRVHEFLSGIAPQDDMTIVVLRVN